MSTVTRFNNRSIALNELDSRLLPIRAVMVISENKNIDLAYPGMIGILPYNNVSVTMESNITRRAQEPLI